jgi:hypothetical protein
MEASTLSILPHTLWPLLTLAMVALWTAAMADITRHRRRGTFTRTGLVCMAVTVSAVAVIALAGIGAVFSGQRFEAPSRAVDVPADTYLFSFGLEHASDAMPARPAGAKQREQPG